ncbi:MULTISPECIES: NADPH-dependent FMN reductase [Microtetraspora]|uniref:NAD(P)H-dependent oxidoreductase n=1 Tax=Microtetraspora glauca TaxID=1996 RepID=A0ABV3G797_MICGL|nr:NAD(P)H-dependent oxidoreductase [Microtetraspora sp. AC03309]MCC5574745.1 NAD(P)H-dependent oxidoreductase [Microtetraspora sp. AC03309]
MSRPILQIIVASTRPGRVGLPVAEWFRDRAVAQGVFDVEVVDLAEVDLPFMNEPHHPRLRQYVHQHTKEWSATVERADAFVLVTPEYNHSFNAVLKNALDYLHGEWQYKPVGFVSYGGVSAGTRAVQMLKQIVSGLKMLPVVEAVAIPFVREFVDEEGRVRPNDVMNQSADAMLAEIARLAPAFHSLRAPSAP